MILNLDWSSPVLGTDFYHITVSFVLYSILGWFVESVYMSFCNKKITNRGFAKGPFCPIYGFGATLGCIALNPFKQSFMAVYLIGGILATVFEYFAGVLMIKALGALWWDYNNKPYNYKGIICLESSIAWGFYAIGVVEYLNDFIFGIVDKISNMHMIVFCEIALTLAVIDYIIRLSHIFHEPIDNAKERVVAVYRNFHDRWF